MKSRKYDDTNKHTYITTSNGEKMDDHHIYRSMLDKGREAMEDYPTFQSVGTISTNDGSCISTSNLPFD